MPQRLEVPSLPDAPVPSRPAVDARPTAAFERDVALAKAKRRRQRQRTYGAPLRPPRRRVVSTNDAYEPRPPGETTLDRGPLDLSSFQASVAGGRVDDALDLLAGDARHRLSRRRELSRKEAAARETGAAARRSLRGASSKPVRSWASEPTLSRAPSVASMFSAARSVAEAPYEKAASKSPSFSGAASLALARVKRVVRSLVSIREKRERNIARRPPSFKRGSSERAPSFERERSEYEILDRGRRSAKAGSRRRRGRDADVPRRRVATNAGAANEREARVRNIGLRAPPSFKRGREASAARPRPNAGLSERAGTTPPTRRGRARGAARSRGGRGRRRRRPPPSDFRATTRRRRPRRRRRRSSGARPTTRRPRPRSRRPSRSRRRRLRRLRGARRRRLRRVCGDRRRTRGVRRRTGGRCRRTPTSSGATSRGPSRR